METKKVITVGVISSLVATIIFLYFLDPIIKFSGYLIIELGKDVFDSYLNRLIRQAALMSGPDPSYYILIFILITLWTSAIIITYLVFVKKDELSSSKPTRTKNLFGNKRRRKVIMFILDILLTLSIFMSLFGLTYQNKIVTSFNQHLTAISPFTTSQNILLIKSHFAQMESKSDYQKIYSEIETIAKDNNVKLLDNYIYNFFSY